MSSGALLRIKPRRRALLCLAVVVSLLLLLHPLESVQSWQQHRQISPSVGIGRQQGLSSSSRSKNFPYIAVRGSSPSTSSSLRESVDGGSAPSPSRRRRDILQRWPIVASLSCSAGILLLPSDAATAATTAAAQTPDGSPTWECPIIGKELVEESEPCCRLESLSDLPPLEGPRDASTVPWSPSGATSTVRIYLCRHGQTEYNRLGLAQGARVDAPINGRGRREADLLGEALMRASPPPSGPVLHSPLQRARETAARVVAAAAACPVGGSSSCCGGSNRGFSAVLKELASLSPIDYGNLAKRLPSRLVRARMESTYAAWSAGDLDRRIVFGDGENANEVLCRVRSALESLRDEAAKSPTKCVAAVSHSSFIRVVLASLLDDYSFLEAYRSIELSNGGINVIDLANVGEGDACAVNGLVNSGLPESLENDRSLFLRGRLFMFHDSASSERGFVHRPAEEALVQRINENRHVACLGN